MRRTSMLRPIINVLLLAALLTVGLTATVALAAPGGGADVTTRCFDTTTAADVDGTECQRVVTTPSNNNNINGSSHVTPDVEGEGGDVGTLYQGAQHNLGGHCDEPIDASCNTTYTPSGNAHGTFHTRT